MKKKNSMVLSSVVLSGAVMVMAPQAWSQTSGAGNPATPSQQSSDRGSTGSSTDLQNQRDQSGSRGTSGSMGSSHDLQTQKDHSGKMGSSRRTAGSGHMSMDKVKEVQAALKSKGMDPGPEDGMMGPKTQAALREFQKSNNLQATGRIDEKTASALGVEMAGASSMGSSSGMGSSSSGSSSGMGKSSSGRSSTGSGSAASGSKSGPAGYPDSTSLGKGSTAGKLESTDGNPQ